MRRVPAGRGHTNGLSAGRAVAVTAGIVVAQWPDAGSCSVVSSRLVSEKDMLGRDEEWFVSRRRDRDPDMCCAPAPSDRVAPGLAARVTPPRAPSARPTRTARPHACLAPYPTEHHIPPLALPCSCVYDPARKRVR